MILTKRDQFVQRAAEVTAQIYFDLSQGRGDTSMVEIDGKMTMKPYLPEIYKDIGTPENERLTMIRGGDGEGTITLTAQEENQLTKLTDMILGGLVRDYVKNLGKETAETLMEGGRMLIERAKRIDHIVLVGMPTRKEQTKTLSKDFVIIAPNSGVKGSTLLHPEPMSTGQRHVGS